MYCIIICVIDFKILRWVGRMARMWREEEHAWSWWVNLKERDDVENQAADGIITPKVVFKKWGGRDVRWIYSGSG
jgi:hypothetical protein